MSTATLIRGDARRLPLADGSVHCCVTSPPYWGLRDYGVDGQIGLERTPAEFVAAMVAVFREVRRVLRDDGTAWVNLGDSYAAAGPQTTGYNEPDWIKTGGACQGGKRIKVGNTGLKTKDLVGIPWRVAFALQDDGWYLRSDIIWAKCNPMPESVTDRPSKSHEYLFLLSKSERYFYDMEAVREKATCAGANSERKTAGEMEQAADPVLFRTRPVGRNCGCPSERNLRTVWTIPTEAYPGAHFATYPRKLVEPCIKAGTSERGVCRKCGAPWVREVSVEQVRLTGSTGNIHVPGGGDNWAGVTARTRKVVSTLGWRPGCTCDAGEPVPATVLDPFVGSGTTLVVASALGRRAIGCDLKPEYLALARRRIERPHARTPRPAKDEALPLFAAEAAS